MGIVRNARWVNNLHRTQLCGPLAECIFREFTGSGLA